MRVAALFLALLYGPAWAVGEEVTTAYAPLLDDKRDEIVRSEFVPTEEQPVGEVRLIRRGQAVVMQTVLHTALLKRVVAEIRKKELASWPPDRKGHDDAQEYIDAITTAQQRIQERHRRREGRGDRRQKMLIEFILSGRASIVAISEPELGEKSGHMRVTSRRTIATLELSRTYVRGNIYEIAWDALRLDRKESRKLLEPMLPPESPSSREPSEVKGN
jgi:hypothetical protein